jgi:oligoendopeptidase F
MAGCSYEKGHWTLDDLISARTGPAMEQAFDDVEAAVAALEATRANLVPSISEAAFVEALGLVETLAHASRKLHGYSVLFFAEQTGDQGALALRGRVDKALAGAQNRTLFFDLWWKRLDDENARRLLPVAGDITYYLETLRKFAPFTLTEPEEKVINVKNINGVEGLVTLYEMITNAFTYDLAIDGETKTLTRSEVMVYARDPSPARREAAYRALLKTYEDRSGELAQIYKYVAGDWSAENVGLRGVASPISVRNLANDIPDEVVDLLLKTCRENVGLYQRFFRLKAGWLGLPKLRRFDIYAPLESASTDYPFAKGVDLVLESLRGFSPEAATLAEKVLAEGHLDSSPRPGKDTGAFCYGVVPDVTPWVLVNYNDRADDVTTLAHELGHAVHAMIAADHSILTFHSSLPLAETASNFVEMLLLEALLEQNGDPELRRTLLAKYVDDSYASVLRQSFFVLFEREAHRMIAEEEATLDELSEAYLENLREQFGDSLELADEFKSEWVSIPHIYATPFYCYAYTFGLLLVLGLFQRYKAEGNTFVPKYLKILSYGGSKAPMAILDEAGIDIRTREFWQGGFDVLAGMIDELETLS